MLPVRRYGFPNPPEEFTVGLACYVVERRLAKR